jgi:excisionase family DNA binding protein
MEILSFDKLPEAVSMLLEKVSHIELLLEGQPQQVQGEDLLTISQASQFLDLAVPTLYSKVSRKEIPVNKQGKRLYFYKSELQEWIKQGRKRTFAEIRDSVQFVRGRNRKQSTV